MLWIPRTESIMPIVIPRLLLWALGAIGAAAMARVVAHEWKRVNAELERQEQEAQAAREAAAPEHLPKLRRDESGVYRPE
jgi:beta-lactamase regulating signal transducer with metallopeptidase domain